MKEAVGNAMLFNIVVTFVAVFIILFVGSTSYTKAVKIKNKIINIIESDIELNPDENLSEQRSLAGTRIQGDIDSYLAKVGYLVANSTNDCTKKISELGSGDLVGIGDTNSGTSGYKYCVIRFSSGNRVHYGVITYIYIDLPLAVGRVQYPIYGETKSFIVD